MSMLHVQRSFYSLIRLYFFLGALSIELNQLSAMSKSNEKDGKLLVERRREEDDCKTVMNLW